MNWTCADSIAAAFVAGFVVASLLWAWLLRRKPDGPGVE